MKLAVGAACGRFEEIEPALPLPQLGQERNRRL